MVGLMISFLKMQNLLIPLLGLVCPHRVNRLPRGFEAFKLQVEQILTSKSRYFKLK